MLLPLIDSDKLDLTLKALTGSRNVVTVAHISPDGDAMGSSLAMFHLLKAMNKNVNVVLNDKYSDKLAWLPAADQITIYESEYNKACDIINNADLIFCMDFNAPKRMGKMESEILASSAMKILIDHHLYPDSFCDIVISYPKMSSTCELVFRFIKEASLFNYMNQDIATSIYTGMMTDTGAFTYNSNSPEIYVIISELLMFGINKDKIYDRVNNTFSEDRERLMGYTINDKMIVYPEYQAALIWLTQDELKKYKYKKGDTEGFVNIPLSIKGINFSVFIREDSEYIKISLRSKGDFPANIVSENQFNGGEHKNAAGGEYFGTMNEAINLFESILPLYTQYLKKE